MITVKQTRTIRVTDGEPVKSIKIEEIVADTKEKAKSCKFASLGCDVEQVQKDHEQKRPIKHLAVTNDTMRGLLRQFEKLNSQFNTSITQFDYVKASGNRMAVRGGQNYLWKITNWSHHFKQAQKRTVPLIFSKPFYSAVHSYRMVASFAPFGQGKTFGHHASVFIQLVEGDFDQMLKWPFRAPIIFTVWDQKNDVAEKKNMSVRVTPNTIPVNIPFLMQPKNGPNVSFGCDKFIHVDLLSNKTSPYVKDDTLFVEISVDMMTEMLS
ncbi:hypothetical protein L596_000714 [Steinernema carpocapsae]|uniref:MATH domain-containing protein n=1 Tax=Steinernema carpocapsae TaxID=34508 RepID=A0A4U8UJQ4_STECR|nr:hypothetical protein L596_000714 [Steinernema carpocapsae]